MTTHGRTYAHQPHGAAYVTAISGAGATFHFPGPSSASAGREEERKQPLYLAHQAARYDTKSDRDRGRLAVAPPAHVQQPIALTTTRAGSITSGYPVHSLTLARSSLPAARHAGYTQAAQLQVAQQLAAQQAAVQAQQQHQQAAGATPTTRYKLEYSLESLVPL